jgi:hypothetical protein
MQRSMITSTRSSALVARGTPKAFAGLKNSRRVVRVASLDETKAEEPITITQDQASTSSMGNQTAAYGEPWNIKPQPLVLCI